MTFRRTDRISFGSHRMVFRSCQRYAHALCLPAIRPYCQQTPAVAGNVVTQMAAAVENSFGTADVLTADERGWTQMGGNCLTRRARRARSGELLAEKNGDSRSLSLPLIGECTPLAGRVWRRAKHFVKLSYENKAFRRAAENDTRDTCGPREEGCAARFIRLGGLGVLRVRFPSAAEKDTRGGASALVNSSRME